MRKIKVDTPLSPAEVTRLLRAGGTYSAHTVAHPTGMGWELGLPDGYQLRSLNSSQRAGLARGRTPFAPKPASTSAVTARNAAPSSTEQRAFKAKLSGLVEDMLCHKLSHGEAVIEMKRAAVLATGDSSAWESSSALINEQVAKVYGSHRLGCGVCQAGDPDLTDNEIKTLFRELDHQIACRASQIN